MEEIIEPVSSLKYDRQSELKLYSISVTVLKKYFL